jgi:hypothetical protein
MEVTTTPIEGLLILQPKIWKDDRGYFFESFREDVFSKLNIDVNFVQDNQSLIFMDMVLFLIILLRVIFSKYIFVIIKFYYKC